uniref:NADH-ubiquinone oxidoreductase chain 2 n=1 Tax=Criotettix japonicus TaxID=2793210 RepID=A0A7U3QC56_9ORTH|nr:NADH dehydrogenase subunit 2 [Criotettix japonicus]
MNKSPMKMLFINLLIFSTMISISANNWLGVWMGLEINLLMFLPLIMSNSTQYLNSSGIKYFIVQSMASIILLIMIMKIMINENNDNYYSFIILIMSLMMKMGAAPFHFWFPEMMEQLNWNNCILIMTWQKLAPMLVLSYILPNKIMMVFIVLSAMIGAIMGLNQISLRLILAYSSINHMGWMLAAIQYSIMIWFCYFTIYSLMTTLIVLLFKYNNVFMLNEVFMMKNPDKLNKLNLMLSMLSLGGLPPLLGFLPKWMLIQELMLKSSYMITTILIISSVITLYFYLKLFFSASLISFKENKWNNFNLMNLESLLLYFNIMSSLGLTLSMITIY